MDYLYIVYKVLLYFSNLKLNLFLNLDIVNWFVEVYHQRFRVNRLLVFIGAGVLIGALKLSNTYT